MVNSKIIHLLVAILNISYS